MTEGATREMLPPEKSFGGLLVMLRRTFAGALPLALFAAPVRAQATKKLVVYTSNDSTLNDLVFGAFRTETGIEVEPVAAGSGVVMRRLQAEKARPLGDIVWGVSRSLLQTNKTLFEPYASKNIAATRRNTATPTICGSATTCICW